MAAEPRGRRAAAIALAMLAALATSRADARMSVLYDSPETQRQLLGVQPDGSPGLGAGDGVVQQQPAPRILGSDRQAWKVSGGVGSGATPSLLGRGPQGIAALLRSRIRRSGAHLIFLDELSSAFRGRGGDDLAQAMAVLAAERDPWGGEESLARRVHIYVPAPSVLLAAPRDWSGAWRALTLAGGVWLEAYRRAAPWTPEQWLSWPGPFARALTLAGGDSSRLHLVLSGAGQAEQWGWARTGDACVLLANGPGAYRLGAGAAGFIAEFRRTFGVDSASSGPSPVQCRPAPRLADDRAAALAGALAFEAHGLGLGPGMLRASPPWVGWRTPVEVRLGPDPLGLAAALGVHPARFWGGAGARLSARGTGWRTGARVGRDGAARLVLRPTAPGPIRLRLVVPGAAVRRALGGPTDLVGSLTPYAGEIGGLALRLVTSPESWRLVVPLVPSGADPGAPALGALPAPPPEAATELALGLAGPGASRRAGRDPGRWRLAVLRTSTADGLPVPGAALALRRQDGRGLRLRTAGTGQARAWVSLRPGTIRATVRASAARARLRLHPRRSPARLRVGWSGRRAPRRGARVAVAVVRDRFGRRWSGAPLRVRRPDGHGRRLRSDRRGRAFLTVPVAPRGPLVVGGPGASRRLAPPGARR